MKLKATKTFRTNFIFALLLFAVIGTTVTTAATKDNELSPLCRDLAQHGLPSPNVRLLCKTRFLIGYSDETKTPLWTIERLGRSRIPISTGRESQQFKEDFDVPTEFRASLPDYVSSGFDRGHLVAAGNYVDDPNAYRETFLLSNVAPQVGPGFNRGIWRSLEEEIRNLAQCTDELIVYTALVFPEIRPSRTTIGKSRVNVPSGFIKVLYLPREKKLMGFYAENRKHDSTAVSPLLRSVDKIETLSSYDFLSMLPDPVEKDLESFRPTSLWVVLKQRNQCSITMNDQQQ